MDHPRERLTAAREAAGKSIPATAAQAGITEGTLHDLENCDDDIYMTISIADLQRLCSVVGTDLRILFNGKSDPTGYGLVGLAKAIKEHLIAHGITEPEFGDEIGWDVTGFADDPQTALEWNIDCLKAVSEALGTNWIDALPG